MPRGLLILLTLGLAAQPLGAQRVAAVGDTVRITYRTERYATRPSATARAVGALRAVTTDSVVLESDGDVRAVALRDVVAVSWLAGRGFNWRRASLPMAIGGGVGLMLGLQAAGQDDLSGGEAVLAVAAFTATGVMPGFVRGLDSRGVAGATIGGALGAGVGLAVGLATKPDPAPPCHRADQICFPDLSGVYPIATTAIGLTLGLVGGGIIGSLEPGARWEKAGLPPTTVAVRGLSDGRLGIGLRMRIP